MPLGASRLNSLARYIPPVGGVTDPSGGVQFELANTEWMSVTSLSGQQTDSHYSIISTWFKLDSLPGSGVNRIMVNGVNGDDQNATINLMVRNVSGDYRIRYYTHYRVGFLDMEISYSLETGVWYHVVAKANMSGTGRKQIWVNGVREYDAAADNTGYKFPYDGSDSAGGTLDRYYISGNRLNGALFDGCLTQVYQTASDIDIDTNISDFYDNGYVDYGASGTSSGLPSPQIYHYGTTIADFDNVNGSVSGTVTVNGTISDCT